jgi:CxxC-x17-CxxC domain-containing protein
LFQAQTVSSKNRACNHSANAFAFEKVPKEFQIMSTANFEHSNNGHFVVTNSDKPEFTDISINCTDCGQDFIWTVGEQQFFHDKNLQNPPKRCKSCKQAKNERIAAAQAAQAAGIKQKIEVAVNCAQCGSFTTVPFYPSQGRPVYCRSCFLASQAE